MGGDWLELDTPHTMLVGHWPRLMEGLSSRSPHLVTGTHLPVSSLSVPGLRMKIFNYYRYGTPSSRLEWNRALEASREARG